MKETTMRTPAAPLLLVALLLQPPSLSQAAPPALVARPNEAEARARYTEMVRRVAAMATDGRARQLAARHRLDIMNVLWEDTGRWEGSSVGPNISDVTIEVEMKDSRGHRRTALMPVIRYPNFTDKTGDVAIDRIWIPVGNQSRAARPPTSPARVPRRADPLPDTAGQGQDQGRLAARQARHPRAGQRAAHLPADPQSGKATFWPVIFNYQSTRQNPAVLTLLITRQGTSVTVVDNARDTVNGQSWGQRLFFNPGGQRTPLIAERLSTVKANGVTANGEAAASLGADANLLMIVQVPLKVRAASRDWRCQRPRRRRPWKRLPSVASGGAPSKAKRSSDVEAAVLGHGPELGPYTELAGLTIERDPRFPVRVTVQFYQATSNGVVTATTSSRWPARSARSTRAPTTSARWCAQ